MGHQNIIQHFTSAEFFSDAFQFMQILEISCRLIIGVLFRKNFLQQGIGFRVIGLLGDKPEHEPFGRIQLSIGQSDLGLVQKMDGSGRIDPRQFE